ncbi:hypothetical protein [Nonomuraea sp. NPDC049695]|uniref:hypothetical protein n=1 Tax=Nonomuraea sp. NPDC049695 TaxID=3154734 RepID=UPI0034285AED
MNTGRHRVVETRLGSGMRVALSPDPTVPIVGVSLWYAAGSREDGPGRAGLATPKNRRCSQVAGTS